MCTMVGIVTLYPNQIKKQVFLYFMKTMEDCIYIVINLLIWEITLPFGFGKFRNIKKHTMELRIKKKNCLF